MSTPKNAVEVPNPVDMAVLAREWGVLREVDDNGLVRHSRLQGRLTDEGRWGSQKICGASCYRRYLHNYYDLSERDVFAILFKAYPPLRGDEDLCRCGRESQEHLAIGCATIEEERQDRRSKIKMPRKPKKLPDEEALAVLAGEDCQPLAVADPENGQVTVLTMPKTIDWVLANLKTKVTPKDAPTPKAWSLLLHARETPAFVTSCVNKLMAREEEHHDPMMDDGRETLELVKKMREFYPIKPVETVDDN